VPAAEVGANKEALDMSLGGSAKDRSLERLGRLRQAIEREQSGATPMTAKLNKKQKKQIDVERKRLTTLKQQLAGAKRQPDDLAEIRRLEQEIAACEEKIKKIEQA
jgi:hypothetical protein